MVAQYILISSMNFMLKSCTSDCQRENNSANVLKKSLWPYWHLFWCNDLFPRNKAFSLELSTLAFSPSPKETFTTIAMTVGWIGPSVLVLIFIHRSVPEVLQTTQSWKLIWKHHCRPLNLSWSLRENWIHRFYLDKIIFK